MMKTYTVAFFGHRYIENHLKIETCIDEIIGDLLCKNEYIQFLVGRNGDFDQIVSSAVCKAKRIYGDENIFHILVLPYLTAEYKNNAGFFEEYYDEIEICHKSAMSHFKNALLIRNREMVDRADLIVCFVDHKYGGAYNAMQYAGKKKKEIININKREIT